MRESCIGERIGESDHNSVITFVRAHKPALPVKTVTYRPLKSLDVSAFGNDLSLTSFVRHPSHDLESTVDQFTTSITIVLDTHAPWRWKTVIIHPRNLWFSDHIAAQRRLFRRTERLWRKRRLAVDADVLRMQQKDLAESIHRSKSTYYRNKIEESNGDRRGLFRVVNEVMLRSHIPRLPQHTAPTELAKRFANFFQEKMSNIRVGLGSRVGIESNTLNQTCVRPVLMSSFRPATTSEIRSIIMSSPRNGAFSTLCQLISSSRWSTF